MKIKLTILYIFVSICLITVSPVIGGGKNKKLKHSASNDSEYSINVEDTEIDLNSMEFILHENEITDENMRALSGASGDESITKPFFDYKHKIKLYGHVDFTSNYARGDYNGSSRVRLLDGMLGGFIAFPADKITVRIYNSRGDKTATAYDKDSVSTSFYVISSFGVPEKVSGVHTALVQGVTLSCTTYAQDVSG